jgi:hypothetical protein
MAITASTPEWVDEKAVNKVFGITRTPLYNLRKANKIRSLSLKLPGATYGKRLYNVASIRELLAELESNEGRANA